MMNLGPQLERLRKQRKISLTELSKTSGVQIATLSRIEHGKMTGTLESHINIARALGIDLVELYKNIDAEAPVEPPLPSDQNIVKSCQQASYEILARQLTGKKMMPRLVRIDPKGATNEETLVDGSECFVHVLDGNVCVRIKDQETALPSGSSFYFRASQPHTFINPGDKTARLITVTTPVVI